jgi:hypothetical protein
MSKTKGVFVSWNEKLIIGITFPGIALPGIIFL